MGATAELREPVKLYRVRLGIDVFTTGQVAGMLAVAMRTVTKWIDAGHLSGYRLPGSQDRRIPRKDLVRFCRDNGMNDLADELHAGALLAGVDANLAARLGHLLGSVITADGVFDLGQKINQRIRCVVLDAGSLGRAVTADLCRRLARQKWPRVVVLAGEDDGEWESFKAVAAVVLRQPCGAEQIAAAVRGDHA